MEPLVIMKSASMLAAPGPILADVRVLPPKGINRSVYLDIDRFARQTAWAHSFMHAYALWLGAVLLAVVFVAAYAIAWWRRAPRAAALLLVGGIGTLVALALNQVIGHAAKELRPYVTYRHALVLVSKAHDYSFPSDHAVVAGGLTLSLLLILGRQTWRRRHEAPDGRGSPGAVRTLAAVNVVLGLFLCFARLYVGAHYLDDVVAGYLLAAVVVLVLSLLRPLVFRAVDLMEPTVLGALWRRPGPVAIAGAGARQPQSDSELEAEPRPGMQ